MDTKEHDFHADGRRGAQTLRERLGEEGYREHMRKIGRAGGNSHKERADADTYYKNLAKRGGKRFSELMEDEDYREAYKRRVRLAREFGVKQDG